MLTTSNLAPLIKVEQREGRQVVSARDLYAFLEVTERFSNWCERMFSYGFVENQDYTSVKNFTLVNNGAKREIDDYALTLSCAKEIAMLQRNERGKEARQYFIDCEKTVGELQEAVNESVLDDIDMIIALAQKTKQHRAELNQLKAHQQAEDARRAESQAYMAHIQAEPIRAMQVDTRKAVDTLVKSYAEANSANVPDIYQMLYKEFSMRYHKDLRNNAKKAKLTQIAWIESNGYITELYEIAKEVLLQKKK